MLGAEVSRNTSINWPHVVCLAVKPVGEPDAGDRHVRFDERGWETGRWALAPSYRAHPRLCLLPHREVIQPCPPRKVKAVVRSTPRLQFSHRPNSMPPPTVHPVSVSLALAKRPGTAPTGCKATVASMFAKATPPVA